MVLKILTATAGLAAAAALGWMVWQASRADGVVIAAFTTPPELAQRGLSGEALSRRLMDRLTYMARTSQSAEDQRGVSGDWGGSLSIQIPQTGVSIGQVDQWLRQKLGHESHVSADLSLRRDGRLQIAARSNANGFPILTGTEDELQALIEKTAESVYAREQPHSYAGFLASEDRLQDAVDFMRPRTTAASAAERAWALNFLGTLASRTQGLEPSSAYYRRAMAEDPAWPVAVRNLAQAEANRGHPETAYRFYSTAIRLYADPKWAGRSRGPAALEANRNSNNDTHMNVALQLGDFNEVRRLAEASRGRLLLGQGGVNTSSLNLARAFAGRHEVAAAERALADFTPEVRRAPARIGRAGAATVLRMAAQDWTGALASADEEIAIYAASGLDGGDLRVRPVPMARKALALAHLGRFDEAEAAIASTPLDCQPCVQYRGAIAALAGKPQLADHWFGEAVRTVPSLPQANTDWGQVLLERGQADRAIERFAAAARQSPKFADPIQYWGEALLTKGDAKGAAAKFAAAEKLAPKWGRLHLKWGEALATMGKVQEAQAHFRIAAGLDLTASERAELARVQR
jgi:tetratricopeptide (TPR) repeat protein